MCHQKNSSLECFFFLLGGLGFFYYIGMIQANEVPYNFWELKTMLFMRLVLFPLTEDK